MNVLIEMVRSDVKRLIYDSSYDIFQKTDLLSRKIFIIQQPPTLRSITILQSD